MTHPTDRPPSTSRNAAPPTTRRYSRVPKSMPGSAQASLRSFDTNAFSLAPKGPHSPRGPRATADELREVFGAFDIPFDTVREVGSPGPRGPRFHVVGPEECVVGRRFASLDAELGDDDPIVLAVEGRPSDSRLAMWRNALWPLVHVGAILYVEDGRARRITLSGADELDGEFDFEGAVLFGRRTSHVMGPDATVEKFDRNASHWDGDRGGAGYPHYRWMRRFVARFGRVARDGRGSSRRVLDFGCGAGWVGIEAAKIIGQSAELCAFDPSPEMVKIAESNAAAEGVKSFTGRTGFGEAPPFGQSAEQPTSPFDLVLSSGVASFSPDIESWLDGLAATVAAGGDLIVGDIHPASKGFRRRRRRKPLLPVREMNAFSREEIRQGLERRGFVHVRSGAYQLTRPIPEAMHVSETMLKGLLTYPLLWANRIASRLDSSFGSPLQDRFDSWVMVLSKPSAAERSPTQDDASAPADASSPDSGAAPSTASPSESASLG